MGGGWEGKTGVQRRRSDRWGVVDDVGGGEGEASDATHGLG